MTRDQLKAHDGKKVKVLVLHSDATATLRHPNGRATLRDFTITASGVWPTNYELNDLELKYVEEDGDALFVPLHFTSERAYLTAHRADIVLADMMIAREHGDAQGGPSKI